MILNFGYLINGGLDFMSESREHEWLNGLKLQLGFTRTEETQKVVKSLDTIDFKTSYLYHLPPVKWLGPFVSFRLSTAMLPGYAVKSTDTNVLRLEKDDVIGATDGGSPTLNDEVLTASNEQVETVRAHDKIELTDAFAPLTLKEAAGIFAVPINKENMRLDIRAGFGAWETFVRDGFTVADNEDTADYFELRRMQDSVQLGPELGLGFTGMVDKNVNYAFTAVFMQPVYHNADTDLEGFELLNMEFEALLGVKLAEWISIDYAFKAVKQPLLVEDWQIQNNLLVSIGFDIVGGEAPPPPPCDCSTCPPAATEAGAQPPAAPEAPAAPETPEEPATETETEEAPAA